MNKKKWFCASVAAFVVAMVLEYIYNTYCLKNLYMATAQFWRPEADIKALMPYYWVTMLVASFFFVYIYTKGYEAKPKPIFEGLRFGFILGLFVNLPMSVITYVTMPLPTKLPVNWFITGMVEYMIVGVVIGLVYNKKECGCTA